MILNASLLPYLSTPVDKIPWNRQPFSGSWNPTQPGGTNPPDYKGAAGAIASFFDWQSSGQERTIGQHGADPDEDRIVPITQAVGFLPRFGAGDPTRMPGTCRDATVERHGIFRGHFR